MRYRNQLEPEGLLRHFLLHPPKGFHAWLDEDGVPLFATDFDLLTTMDAVQRRAIASLPLFRFWRRLLRPHTCFVGTTVSEYALLPETASPAELAERLKNTFSRHYPFLIVKDIPCDSPLQNGAANAFSLEFSRALEKLGFILIEGQALAWVPVDYENIEDYLSRLSGGRRRDLRRKLKKKAELDIQELAGGDECFLDESLIDHLYDLYLNVYRQSEIHFDLLSRSFFAALLRDETSDSVIFTYRHEQRIIGYNVCFVVNDQLIDKYIGLDYPAARHYNLYFVSWFHNLDYALKRGLRRYVAGWTDPEIKAYLGARFTFTRHAVHVRNPVLRRILRRLSGYFENDRQWREPDDKRQPGLT